MDPTGHRDSWVKSKQTQREVHAVDLNDPLAQRHDRELYEFIT